MKNEIFENICEILERHVQRYEMLVACVEREKQGILEFNGEKLFELSMEKEMTAQEIQNSLPYLLSAIHDTARYLDLPTDPQPLLASLVHYMPGEYAKRAEALSIKLEHLKNITLRESFINSYYIEEAMRLVGSAIRALSGLHLGYDEPRPAALN